MDFPVRMAIKKHTISIAARYAETDQGGVVHHSVYPVWFEMGRIELLRVNGLAYKKLEEAGIFLVVVELYIKYRQPARYDEKLELETTFSNITASKIENSYRLTRCDDGTLLVEGSTIVACIDSKGKVQRILKFMYAAPEETIA